MKNTKKNVESFATAKLQAKRRSLLAIIAIVAVIGFTLAACGDNIDSVRAGRTYAVKAADGSGQVGIYRGGTEPWEYVPDGTELKVASVLIAGGNTLVYVEYDNTTKTYYVNKEDFGGRVTASNTEMSASDKEKEKTVIKRLAMAAFQVVELLVVIIYVIRFLKQRKAKTLTVFTAYYAAKRKEYPWLNNWLNGWKNKNVDPVQLRAESAASGNKWLSLIVFVGIILIGNIVFDLIGSIISIAVAFLAVYLISKKSAINPGDYVAEQGLTLECPSCNCPHSWVMLQRETIVERMEKTTRTTTRKGYGTVDPFESMMGMKGDGTESKTSIVYYGRSIKDFECKNCNHTEQNEYDESWPSNRDDWEMGSHLQKFNPPHPAWEFKKK